LHPPYRMLAGASAGSRNTVELMSEAFEELHIDLEDAATRSWLVAMLGTLAMQTQQRHFVGMVDGELRYHSGTFASPYSWGIPQRSRVRT